MYKQSSVIGCNYITIRKGREVIHFNHLLANALWPFVSLAMELDKLLLEMTSSNTTAAAAAAVVTAKEE